MRPGESIPNRTASEYAVLAAAIVAGIVAVAQSWLRWLHPYIDAGRDLYIPELLRSGNRLYADILYFYPPLTPHLLALLPVDSIGSYVALGFVIAALTAAAMWRIVSPLAGAQAAGAALLLFFALNVCGTGGWGSNYFFPYAHAATIGMLLFLGGAALRNHWAGVLLLLCAAWTKIEFAPFGAAVVAWNTFAEVRGATLAAESRRAVRLAAFYGTTLAVSVTIVLTNETLRANILPPALLGGASARHFYEQVVGFAEWKSNLLLSLRGALLICGVVLLLRYFERYRWAVVAGVALCAISLADGTFFRAWTILQIVLVPFALARPRHSLSFLLLLSACASSRIWLNLTPSWYGFVFTVPLEVLAAYVLFGWLPERGVYSKRASMLWLIVFAAVAGGGLLAARGRDSFAVATPRGTYRDASAIRAQSVEAAVRYLKEVRARELVVMPEGLALNWFAGAPTPLRHQTFTAVEVAGREAEVLRELVERRPERVAIVPRDMREFGYRGFGIDYARDIVSWLRANYVVEQRFGEIVLLRRRS